MPSIGNLAGDRQAADGLLVGRGDVLAAVARLVDDAWARRGGALALVGEPGSGKTMHCRHAAGVARGFRVVALEGVAAEQDVAFGGLSRLCLALADEEAELPPRQAAVIDWLSAGGVERPGPDGHWAVPDAILALLGTVARRQPVLVAVDDLQWLDGVSSEALCFVARRLSGSAVAMLFALTEGVDSGPDLAGVEVRWLDGLSRPHASALFLARSSVDPDPSVATAVVDLTGGNPAALVDVATRLPEEQLTGQRPLPRPLPLGPRVTTGFARRLSAFPPETRTALALVAASSGALAQVLAGLTSLGLGHSELEVAEESGALTMGNARVELAHPLLGAAAYQTISVADRAAIKQVLGGAAAPSPGLAQPGVDHGWSIELLGGFSVVRDGADVTPSANHVGQAVKLIALRGPLTVDELVEALWPDAEAGVGRVRLRNVLNRVRASCGPVLVRDGDRVRLAAGTTVDASVFEEKAAKALVALSSGEDGAMARAREATASYHGELLPADRYVSWAAAPRERLSRRHIELLDTMADESEAAGETGVAIRLVELALDLDPYDESRYVRAARLLMLQGRRAAASSMLHQARVVAEELGVPLSPDAEALASSLVFAGQRPPQTRASTST